MLVLGHIAGLPVEESLAYIAPVIVVVAWIYWAGRRERRRTETAAHDPDATMDRAPTGEHREPARPPLPR